MLQSAVSDRSGRVVATLAGTALLMSSPSGASRIVSGVPDAIQAFDALFAAPEVKSPREREREHERESVRSAADVGAWPERVEVALRTDVSWEAFAWWFARLASRNRHHLAKAFAVAPSLRGAVTVELVDGIIRSQLVPPGESRPATLHLVFDEATIPAVRATILESLHDVTKPPSQKAPPEVNQLKTHSRPRIAFIATGGTIASIPDGDDDGAVPSLTAEDLVSSVPGLVDHADIECVQFAQKPSVELDLADLVALMSTCRAAVEAGAVGVVIAQGTDTIEETSYVLDLLWDRPEPVVVTGAMRNPSIAGSDGPANLLAATRVAMEGTAAGRGVLVVLNDEIHTARDVVKTHTSSTSAFRSWRTGAIGTIHEGQPRFHTVARRRSASLNVDPAAAPPVALVTAVLGDRIPFLETLEQWGYRGVVIEAFGGGHLRSELVPVIRDLAQRIPVVLASRTGAGAILTHTYAFPGGEIDLLKAGVIPAGSLHPLKARLLVSMLLAANADLETVRAEFLART